MTKFERLSCIGQFDRCMHMLFRRKALTLKPNEDRASPSDVHGGVNLEAANLGADLRICCYLHRYIIFWVCASKPFSNKLSNN